MGFNSGFKGLMSGNIAPKPPTSAHQTSYKCSPNLLQVLTKPHTSAHETSYKCSPNLLQVLTKPPTSAPQTSYKCSLRALECIYYCKISVNRNLLREFEQKTGDCRHECTIHAVLFWPKITLFRKLFLFVSSGTNIKHIIDLMFIDPCIAI